MLSNDRYSYFLLTVKDKSRITDTLSAIKKIIPLIGRMFLRRNRESFSCPRRLCTPLS